MKGGGERVSVTRALKKPVLGKDGVDGGLSMKTLLEVEGTFRASVGETPQDVRVDYE